MGDGCTDDSEAVAASFGDARIHWHNLPQNSGYQAAPNNAGLDRARGKYIAYLGHDDLWMPNHLDLLVQKIEDTGADVAYSLGLMIGPPESPARVLTGVTKSGAYEPDALVPPSTFLHRAGMIQDTGGWRDYRELHTPGDIAFLAAAWAAGKRFARVPVLTALKFPGPWRKNVYKNKPSFEQEAYLARLNDPQLLIDELTLLACGDAPIPVEFAPPPVGAPAGWMVDRYRERKGLPRAEGERTSLPLYRDPSAMRAHNEERDIVPAEGLAALYSSNRLPANGIFLGRGWHGLESDGEEIFRWLETDGEIILTSCPPGNGALMLDAESGPSQNCDAFEVMLTDAQGLRVGAATVSYRHPIAFELPEIVTWPAVFRLVAPAGGEQIAGDTRILNLRVFQIG